MTSLQDSIHPKRINKDKNKALVLDKNDDAIIWLNAITRSHCSYW